MNKKLIAVAVSSALAVPVIAQAEGEVRVYGRINQAIDLKDPSGKDSDTDVSTVSSRFGIRYDNDLGNGLAVHGRYEFNVRADNETGITDLRLGTVGISGAFGRFDVGNQWSAYFNTFGTLVSPTYTLGYYLYSSAGGGPFRASNTLKYSNTFGPVHFELDGRLNGSNENGGSGGTAEKLAGDGIGVGIKFAAGDYVTVGLAADYEDGRDTAQIIKEAGIANADSLAAARDVLAAAMVERADNKAESAQAMVRAAEATARAMAAEDAAEAAREATVEARDAHQLTEARQTIAMAVEAEDLRLSAADNNVFDDFVMNGVDDTIPVGIDAAINAVRNAPGLVANQQELVDAARERAKIARRALDDATAAVNEAANAAERIIAEAERVVAVGLDADRVTEVADAVATLQGVVNGPTGPAMAAARLTAVRAAFNPVVADTPDDAAIRARGLTYLVSRDNLDNANEVEAAANEVEMAANELEMAANLAEEEADAERVVIAAEVAAEVAVIDGAIEADDEEIEAAELNIAQINAITNDPARVDDTTRYGIAVKVQLGELPVSVTGGWQNVDTEKAGLNTNGSEATDNDVDTWFLWFSGNFTESTSWLLGYANADGDDIEADQFTWGVYHTIGGGLKVYYEAVSVDVDKGGLELDGNRHLLGLRIDF